MRDPEIIGDGSITNNTRLSRQADFSSILID